MKAKAEEFLYLLLWTCDVLSHPTWRNFTDSFEGWAYRNGLRQELVRLEQKQWLECQSAQAGERLHRLTESGRLHALGGRDPVTSWNRRWGGRWRLVLFDVPENCSRLRDKLRRYLQGRGFGYLQHSVWISPHPVELEQRLLAAAPVEVGTILLLEARPCGGESDAAIVASAWDFADLNTHYARHQQVLAQCPGGSLDSEETAAVLRCWLGQERQAWLAALSHDPLLPECLWPPNYVGREAWQRRLQVIAAVGERMRDFRKSTGRATKMRGHVF